MDTLLGLIISFKNKPIGPNVHKAQPIKNRIPFNTKPRHRSKPQSSLPYKRKTCEIISGGTPVSPPSTPPDQSRNKQLTYEEWPPFLSQILAKELEGLTATGIKKDEVFIGDISTQCRSGNTTVDLKINTFSDVFTKITVEEALPGIKTALSFNIPDQKSGKVDLVYRNSHAAVNSSVGLNPSPLLDFNAAIGNKDISLGGEAAFDTASATFLKYNAGITFNKPDFSAALILMEKGQTLKASYFHNVNPSTSIAAEMTHRLSSYENSFMIGSEHLIDPIASMKTRFTNNGKVGMLYQREWRPKSLVTFSAEYDPKGIISTSKFGITLSLKP